VSCRRAVWAFLLPAVAWLILLLPAGYAQPAADVVILEDFQSSPVGGLPKGWTWKKADKDKNKPYKIVEEADGNRYLAADDNGESVILGKEIRWDIHQYPFIEFRWRARALPPGGDERFGDLNDSAAGIYITYKKKMGLIPVTAKLVWSTTLEVGSATQRSGMGRPWNVVVDSGEAHLGEWRTHLINMLEVFKATFGGKPPQHAIGIGILSDSNSVHGNAYADYDYIRARKTGEADSRVVKTLKAE